MKSKIKIGDGSKSFCLLWFAAVVFLCISIIFPLVTVILKPTAADFSSVLKADRTWQAVKNTFLECVCSTTLSVITGFLYAFAVKKTDLPFKKFFSAVPVVHLITPPFVGGLAFILLVGRNGFITKSLLGLDISLYGFWGLLLAQTLTFFPIAYLICLQTLNGINPALEQASRSLGAGRFRTFFTVTLPLSAPGIISALLFIGVSVLSDFGNPMIVGGRFRVLAVEIYTQLTGWLNVGTSAVLGIILLLPSLILFALQNHLAKKSAGKTATIGGKYSSVIARKSPVWVKILAFIFCAFISAIVLAQGFAVLAGSFQKLWGVNPEFTLSHIQKIGTFAKELKNSFCFAFISAIISTFLALLCSYFCKRTNSPFGRTIDVVCQIPAAVPGTLFGLALAIASTSVRFKNSAALIILAESVAFLPFSYRVISSVFEQIRPTLDDSARSLGANRIKTLFSVLTPISSGGIFSAFIYSFVRGVGTLSAVIFLVSFKTPLASIKILNLAEQGDWGDSAALALVLTCMTFTILGIGMIIKRKIFAR